MDGVENPRIFFANRQNRTRLFQTLLKKAQSDEMLSPVLIMAQEMRICVGEEEWDNQRATPQLMDHIQQGTFKKEARTTMRSDGLKNVM